MRSQKVDPILYPKYFSKICVISVIEGPDVVKKILQNLSLWGVKPNPRSVANELPIDIFPANEGLPGLSARCSESQTIDWQFGQK